MCKYVVIKSADVVEGSVVVSCDVVKDGVTVTELVETGEVWSRVLRKILKDDEDIDGFLDIDGIVDDTVDDLDFCKKWNIVSSPDKLCTGVQVKTETFNKKVIVSNGEGTTPSVYLINTERALLNIIADNPTANKITILDMA